MGFCARFAGCISPVYPIAAERERGGREGERERREREERERRGRSVRDSVYGFASEWPGLPESFVQRAVAWIDTQV